MSAPLNRPNRESRLNRTRLTSKEAAEYLNITPDVLKRLRQERSIQFYRIGFRTHVYEIAELDAYLKSVNYPRIGAGH